MPDRRQFLKALARGGLLSVALGLCPAVARADDGGGHAAPGGPGPGAGPSPGSGPGPGGAPSGPGGGQAPGGGPSPGISPSGFRSVPTPSEEGHGRRTGGRRNGFLNNEEALHERKAGEIVPLKEALATANADGQSKVIEVKLFRGNGGAFYRIKLRSAEGTISTVHVDALTGQKRDAF